MTRWLRSTAILVAFAIAAMLAAKLAEPLLQTVPAETTE